MPAAAAIYIAGETVITIRAERAGDVSPVRAINEEAFGRPGEADVADRLRQSCPTVISLVAEEDDQLVGHILFTPAVVESPGRRVEGMALAPVAVLPDRQRRGIGSALVRRGLDIVRQQGHPFVIVLGHPEYYPRFGFELASKHNLSCQWGGIPDEAFMVLILDEGAMAGVSGVARFRDEFGEVA